MFTHKQAWRRQRQSERSTSRSVRNEAIKSQESFSRSTSLPNLTSKKNPLEYCAPRHHTMGCLLDSDNKDNVVKFSEQSKVVLIPCRSEYKKHGLVPEIWWEPDDYAYFKASARMEVMDLLDKHNGDVQGALSDLYQPNFAISDDTATSANSPTSAPSPDNASNFCVCDKAKTDSEKTEEEEMQAGDEKNEEIKGEVVPTRSAPVPVPASSSMEPESQSKQVVFSRMPRDSIRSVGTSPVYTPAAHKVPSPSHHPAFKPMHPLALMMS